MVGASPTAVYYVSRHSGLLTAGKVKVIVLDPVNGQEKKQYTLSADGDLSLEHTKLGIVAAGSAPFIYLAEKPFKTVKISPLGTTKFTTLSVENNSGENIQEVEVHGALSANAPAHFLVHFKTANKGWAEVYHIDAKSFAVEKAYQLPVLQGPDAFSSSAIDANTYFTRTTSSDVLLYSSSSHGQLGRWARAGESDVTSRHAAAEVVSRDGNSFAVRVAQTAMSGEWSLIRNGDTAWTRPEMLAGITAAAWTTDLEEQGALVHELFLEEHENPITAFLHRLHRHVEALSGLLISLPKVPEAVISIFKPSEGDTKDTFLEGSTVIVATHEGQVLALDANDHGKILWRYQALDRPFWNAKAIVINHGEAIVLLDGAGMLSFDIRTGALVKTEKSSSETRGVAQIGGAAGDLLVGTSHSGAPYGLGDINNTAIEGSYLVSLSDSGQVSGWTVGSASEPLWTFSAAPGYRVVNAVARPAHDPVASIGKVLGDRSVLYKYLSPNLALLTSVSSTALTIYLIEAVTGAVLFTTTHTGVDTSAPIPSILTENWLAYSFYGNVGTSKTKAFQLVVHELYESAVPNDRGPLGSRTTHSSFDLGSIVQPHVISQSFTIPEMISSLAVTQTSQGITSKQLICTLPQTNSIIGIPRYLLDPRRPIDRDPNANEAEEGLMRYAPLLDFDPKWLLTHSRDVIGVEKVITAPTKLESTSLVFAYGHDIFGTKLSPSMAFDILGKGFNKLSLLLTVVALLVGVLILAPIVRKRQVDQRWKM